MRDILAVILFVQLVPNFIIGIVFLADKMFSRKSLNFRVSKRFDIQPNAAWSGIGVEFKKN
jgi:hypothetical protein